MNKLLLRFDGEKVAGSKVHVVGKSIHSDCQWKISVQDSRIFASCIMGSSKLALREPYGRLSRLHVHSVIENPNGDVPFHCTS
jgi:hypothetical protein